MRRRTTDPEIERRAQEVGRSILGDHCSARHAGHLLLRAHAEGRLHPDLARDIGVETGKHECVICGMRHWTEGEADDCCPGAIFGKAVAYPDCWAKMQAAKREERR